MKVRFGLQIKFLLLFIAFTAILSYGLYKMVSEGYDGLADSKYLEDALGIGMLTASILDGDDMVRYGETLREDEAYRRTRERIDNIKLMTDTYYLYVIYLISETEGVYVYDAKLTEEQVQDNKSDANPLGTPENLADNFDGLPAVLSSGQPSVELDITTTYTGEKEETLGTVYVPLRTSDGEVRSFVGVDVSMSAVRESIRAAEDTITRLILGLCIVSFGALLLLVRISVILPVKLLARHADEIAEGRFGHEIKVRGNDEISEISRVFNRMNHSIGSHMGEIRQMNEAYSKFVPSRIFTLLKRKSITDIRLGDHVRTDISILSYEMSNIEELLKKMSTAGRFLFLNNALQEAIPPVLEREGIIEHFSEGGFTAIYTNGCEQNLVSAIAICEKIREADEDGRFSIEGHAKIGIGITYGQVILGIVGHKERMSAVCAAKYTSLAEHLRRIAEKYYADILITEEAAEQIPSFENHYRNRFIGYLYHSYDKSMVKLYDVYDGDSEERIRRKDHTKELFESGVALFCGCRFREARTAFVNVLKQSPRDNGAREYLYLCNQYYQMEDTSQVKAYIEIY